MCELCSSDPAVRKMAQEGNQMFANRLMRLARYYKRLASGRDKPHVSATIDPMKHDARFAAKTLVDEWL